MRTRLSSAGFTLIEMMVVVAILGILFMIAKNQYRVLQIQSKVNLTKATMMEIYASEALFHREFNQYTSRLDALRFKPSGVLYMDIGFEGDFGPLSPSVPAGTLECNDLCALACVKTWTCTVAASFGLPGWTAYGLPAAFKDEYYLGAHAHFNEQAGTLDPEHYTITLNQNKEVHVIDHAP